MQSVDSRGPAEREAPPESRHVGLIGGLGVGAAVIYYRAIAAGCVDRGVVPRLTIVHAHAPTALAHVTAGRIEELADYLAGFVAELRSVGATLFAIPAVTPHIALGPLRARDSMPIVDMLEVTARGVRDRGFSRVALFGTRFTIEPPRRRALAKRPTASRPNAPLAPQHPELVRGMLTFTEARDGFSVVVVGQIDGYFAAWNEPLTERRRSLLERSGTADVELIHPTWGHSQGIDAVLARIDGYQSALPEAAMFSRAASTATMTLFATGGRSSIGMAVG